MGGNGPNGQDGQDGRKVHFCPLNSTCVHCRPFRVCSSAGRAAVSKAAGRGFESLRTRM